MDALLRLHNSPERLVAGLMTGTSMDGVDAVVVRLRGSGRSLESDLLAFVHTPYAGELREALLRNTDPASSSVADLALLNVRLCKAYAAAVYRALDAAGLSHDALDLVGAHGQTLHHAPKPVPMAGESVRATLQIGDPSWASFGWPTWRAAGRAPRLFRTSITSCFRMRMRRASF